MSRTATVLASGALALLSAAGLSTLRDDSPTVPALSVDDAVLDVGDRPARVPFEVTFVVRNASSRPLRVVGGTTVCTGPSCQLASNSVGTVIPPYGEARHVRELITMPGPFVYELDLYLEDLTGLRTVALRVRGVGVER